MRAAAIVAALAVAGCGLGVGDSSGGSDNLPTLAAGPYARLRPAAATAAAEPWLLTATDALLRDPALLPRADGGLRVWLTIDPVGDAPPEIGYAELPGPRDAPDRVVARVVAADQPWEEGRVGAPAVVADGDRLLLFYQGGVAAPAIGRAESTDDGATWTKAAAPVLAGARAPSAAVVDGVVHLFATLSDRPGVFHAVDDGRGGFTVDPTPVVAPRPDVAGAFDRAAVADPCVLVQELATGRLHWSLWFTGFDLDPGDERAAPSVGYAASFDGTNWQRPGDVGPVLAAPATGPAVLVRQHGGLMLFSSQRNLRDAIAAAQHP